MSDDFTGKLFEGVERMIGASSKALMAIWNDRFASHKAEVESLIKTIPAGPKGEIGVAGPQGERGPEGIPGRDGRDALPMPGPQGEKGIDGRDGKDGKDGITEDRLQKVVTELVEREIGRVVTSIDFDQEMRELKVLGRVVSKLPYDTHVGVWKEGTTYERGHNVTWGGGTWRCVVEKTLAKPDGTSRDWQLIVKPGRDGRDKTK